MIVFVAMMQIELRLKTKYWSKYWNFKLGHIDEIRMSQKPNLKVGSFP